MKRILLSQALALAIASVALSVNAGDTDSQPKRGSEIAVLPPEKPAPTSVFDVSRPYKDPFFPDSTRKRVVATETNVVVNTLDPKQYQLKGISGVAGQELAIINNESFAVGESGNVTLAAGTVVSISVVAINQHSASILVSGQRDPITISLRKDDW